jgi:hypothetical protein
MVHAAISAKCRLDGLAQATFAFEGKADIVRVVRYVYYWSKVDWLDRNQSASQRCKKGSVPIGNNGVRNGEDLIQAGPERRNTHRNVGGYRHGCLCPGGCRLAEYPITIIVPFSDGGSTDMVGRLLAAELVSRLGQKIKVENRIGASGPTELSNRLQATALCYTLAVTSNATLINSSMDAFGADPLREFSPIAYLGAAPNVIVTRTTSGITSLDDLIAKARANPGKLTYSSPGVGTSAHLALELLKIRAGINITHVAFNGSGMSLAAALSGSTDISALNTIGLMRYIRSGEFFVAVAECLGCTKFYAAWM